jgi:CubicO group peptidase (beta-lactamase class C family)
VLKHKTLTEMWQPLHPVKGDESMGLSFFSARRGNTTLVGHTGWQAGFQAFLYLNPATGVGIVAAFNTDSDLPDNGQPSAVERIRDRALELIR